MLIIGYGNPLRGDDAVGLLAAERLLDWIERQGDIPGIEVIARPCLTIELAANLAGHRRALFIDAALAGPAGAIRRRRLQPATERGPLPHVLSPTELLGWCQWLYGVAPRSSLITIAGASFNYAEGRLSPLVESALARLLKRLGLKQRPPQPA